MWAQCWVMNDSDFTITSHAWWWNAVKTDIRLTCGHHNDETDGGAGYKHIAARHERDWQTKLDQIGDTRYS